jgi:CDP-diacylglycerol---glycerol-3-phosphate 3-phosphatidyltransferase
VADPIADKALTGTALVLLSLYGALPWWATGLILLREWGVTALRFWVIRYGIIPASRGGKLKTALQTAAIAWYLWPVPEPFDAVGPWLMGAALVVTVLTGADYVLQALRLRRSAAER